ncbi:hypothetical protein GCM10009304_30530 [Pseudomonas matsuisoli]|uniref:Uncharacterized protein n=1 Tax=Pseudomonas matsuisoli TaxID=1515666 RepID=A0A917PZV4_9PSED|nr:hypothetical protein GCM10009304_30530 [Pseudomonas matsuisoli]
MNLKKELRHDTSHVNKLEHFDNATLEEARHWIELKLSRIESRISYFFGEKTAIFAMLAISWSFFKELGGIPWINETLGTGFTLGNISDSLLLWGGAFVLGISLGAALLKYVAQHYVYQKELLIMALRKKALQIGTPEAQPSNGNLETP